MTNKRAYTNREGVTPQPGSPSTGWAFTDAVIQRDCPRCGCHAGFYCETPSGRKAWPPHPERVVVGPEHQATTIRPAGIITPAADSQR